MLILVPQRHKLISDPLKYHCSRYLFSFVYSFRRFLVTACFKSVNTKQSHSALATVDFGTIQMGFLPLLCRRKCVFALVQTHEVKNLSFQRIWYDFIIVKENV